MNGIYPLTAERPPFLNTDEQDLLKRTLLAPFTDDEKVTFLRICERTRLDPFTKQIYATKRQQKVTQPDGKVIKVPTLVPVTGIIGLTAVADRTGHYNGCEIWWAGPDAVWREEWLDPDNFPAAAKCTVYHKQREHPDTVIARWMSFVGQSYDAVNKQWYVTDFWNRMPDWMLAKCAKAGALRAAFPDPLSNVFIREELESNLSDSETNTEPFSRDEQKIIDNRAREAELLAKAPANATVVDMGAHQRASAAEMAEPAFPEDLPQKGRGLTPIGPQAAPETVTARQTLQPTPNQDDLDMTPAPKPQEKVPAAAPQAESAPPPGAGPGEPMATPWKDHIIKGVDHAKYMNKKIGDLTEGQLRLIAQQWIPAIREQWDIATDEQRADCEAFEAALAYSKTRPW